MREETYDRGLKVPDTLMNGWFPRWSQFRKAFPFRSFTLETFLNGKMSQAEYERADSIIEKCIAKTNHAIWTAAGVKAGQQPEEENELHHNWRQQRLKEHPELYPPGRRTIRLADEEASEYIRRYYEAERASAQNRQPDSDKADDGNDNNKGDSSVNLMKFLDTSKQSLMNTFGLNPSPRGSSSSPRGRPLERTLKLHGIGRGGMIHRL